MSDWTAPKGIPAPRFGLTEVAPEPTLYVKDTGSDLNPGTDAKPRRTIPEQLAAGAVIRVSGLQPPRHIFADGVPDRPVFIQGGIFQGENHLTGRYLVLEGVTSKSGLYIGADHLALRDSEFVGGGLAIVKWLAPDAPLEQIVILRCQLHDIGTPPSAWPTGGDDDAHGIGVGHHASYVWVLDSAFARISGDGVQVNGEAYGALTHHIYIGRNTFDQNRQSGAWAKQSQDVVMSGNRATNMRFVDLAGNPGHGFGGQYQAIRLTILDNDVSACDYGLHLAGDSDGPYGALLAFNRVTNIHNPANSGSNPQARGGAIVCTNNGDKVLIGNTIDDVDTAIGVSPSGGALVVMANGITRALRQAVYEGVTPITQADVSAIGPAYQAIHGVPLGFDLTALVGTPTPAPTPTPVPPPNYLPVCPHTLAGVVGALRGICRWVR